MCIAVPSSLSTGNTLADLSVVVVVVAIVEFILTFLQPQPVRCCLPLYGTDLCPSPGCAGCCSRQSWPGASVCPAGGRRGWRGRRTPGAPGGPTCLSLVPPGALWVPGPAPSRPWRGREGRRCRTRPGPTQAPGRPPRPSWSPWRGGGGRPAGAAGAAGGAGGVCNHNSGQAGRTCFTLYCLILARISLAGIHWC